MEGVIIQKAGAHDAEELFGIMRRCKLALDEAGIYQWTDNYPTLQVVQDDISKQVLYCVQLKGRATGLINISEEQEPEYAAMPWVDNSGRVLVIHRLAVDPAYQGAGMARKLMDFAETYATANGYTSVRLDAYSENKRVLRFYEQRGYEKRGEVYFPGRSAAFYCFEKRL